MGISDNLIISDLIEDYHNKISAYERQQGELNQESKFFAEYRDLLKQQMKSLDVSSIEELKKKRDEFLILEKNYDETKKECELIFVKYVELNSKVNTIKNDIAILETNLSSDENRVNLYKQTLSFLSDLSDVIRGDQISYIESLVTSALNKILSPKKFSFKIVFKESASMPFADFIITDEDGEIDSSDLLKSNGGGIVDILSTVLRLIILELERPRNDSPVLLDEVGKFLSDDYQEKFGEFLKEWSKTFDRQIFLVTHKPGVVKYADKIFKVRKENNRSHVE